MDIGAVLGGAVAVNEEKRAEYISRSLIIFERSIL